MGNLQFSNKCESDNIKSNQNKSTCTIFNSKVDFSKSTILLVQDDKELLAYLNKELKSEYFVLRASSIFEAIEILNNHEVHIVVSEIRIPDLDGILLCRHIKTNPLFGHIPVVFISDQQSVETKILGLNNGADVYIEKPFCLEFLKAQIQNILLNRQKVKNYFESARSIKLDKNKDHSFSNHFLDKLNSIIDKNISELEMNVNQLAKLMNVSRPTLYRKISKYSNLKPHEMIRKAKLKKASELLIEKKFSISLIASTVGYSVQSNFSRDFQRHFGISPRAYMNEYGNSFAS